MQSLLATYTNKYMNFVNDQTLSLSELFLHFNVHIGDIKPTINRQLSALTPLAKSNSISTLHNLSQPNQQIIQESEKRNVDS
jgi:hypothetical protein